MVLYMLDIGLMVRLLDKEDSYMTMETFIKEIGKIIWLKGLEFIVVMMEPDIKVIGIKTKGMVKD